MQKQIRVLLVAPSMRLVGGQAIQGQRLLRNLRREPGIEITFLAMDQELPGPFAILERIRYVRTVSRTACFCVLLVRRAFRCDIIHVFCASFFSFLWAPVPAILVAKIFGKKSILNYRDGRAEEHLRRWRWTVPIMHLADAIVTPSEYLVPVFARFGLHSEHIPNVIETEHLKHRVRTQLRPVFLHNRRLEELYNVPCVLRAFQRVQSRYPSAAMIIAHDGPMRAELERMVEELELRQVKFIGEVAQQMIGATYDDADIYWTCPNFDCMPGSLLECYAAGIPVIATRVGGIPYLLEDDRTGLLVGLDDDVAMAEHAIRLLEDPELVRRLTTAGHAELTRYRWPAVREKWLDMYQRLVPAARA